MAAVETWNDIDEMTSQLAARIWGHRFKSGQRGAEYVLEFLNVLSGTRYSFEGQQYTKNSAVGLRKFIFEGIKDGASRSVMTLSDDEKLRLVQAVQENNVPRLKHFLRNLEVMLLDTKGKEADRSWYARTLYPLHESLLFVELRNIKGAYRVERNFFARGGELYFLMLALGTANDPDRRQFIESRFQALLTRNKIIGQVVSKISSVLHPKDMSDQRLGNLRKFNQGEEVPELPPGAPAENGPLFEAFAEELERLLSIELDIYEMFRLLISLICFQLFRYILERALEQSGGQASFFDCMDGENKHLFQLAARSYDLHENAVKDRLEREFELKLQQTLGNRERVEKSLDEWRNQPDSFMEMMGFQKMRKRKDAIRKTLLNCRHADDVSDKLVRVIREVMSDELKQGQISISHVVSRDGGFATYRRGSASNYRYTMSDEFLQTLVFVVVGPGEQIEFQSFLQTLYERFGIVVGEREAKTCGIYAESMLNARYFQDNERALRGKLQQNGLLIEFSDATAMVRNPYACARGNVYV